VAESAPGPRVILDFEFERGVLSIVVRNLGELPAADVRVAPSDLRAKGNEVVIELLELAVESIEVEATR